MKEFTCLKCEVENGVAVITMDRPPLNLLTYTLLRELWEVLDLLAADKDMRAVIQEDEQLAWRFLRLCARDSRLGFEAANHYFFTRNDLMEKILCCEDLLRAFPQQ